MSAVFIFQHAVTNADFSEYILGLSRIFFNFAADICHIDPQDLVIAVRVRPPDGAHEIAVGQYPSGILCQQCQKLVFNLCQMDLLSVQKNQSLFKINFQPLCLV